jgi:two-component system chemotaxis response regulator CheB
MAYDVVVIGASLGGLSAVSVLLKAMPADFGLPVIVAQHRGAHIPDGDLAEIWQRVSALPVADAEDKMMIEAGHVYVAPADYHLLVETPDRFALSVDAPVLWARPSIDVLFDSAADAFGPTAIGVVLTGASADGSVGLKAIRDRGGCALVQDPATAECAVMPRAALTSTPVNHVLPLEELGRILVALGGVSTTGGVK